MTNDIDSSDRFVAQLRELKPAPPSRNLQLRLEASLTAHLQAVLPGSKPQAHPSSHIIHHPFFQWSAAAAALLTALFLSLESTEHRSSSPLVHSPAEASAPADPKPVFQLVDGKLIPTSARSALQLTSYRGIEVIEGQAYRKFDRGQESYLELIETAPKAP